MGERSIDNMIQREKANKFNNEVEKYNAQLEENQKTFEEAQSQVAYDINRAEIKPMFARLIIKPFKVNPFQKMEVKGSIIVDAGGYTPHAELNPMTGKYEEQNSNPQIRGKIRVYRASSCACLYGYIRAVSGIHVPAL